jgi:predicted kinase
MKKILSFKNFLSEGVNDPAIFKAVFLAGGPGSGKSFIVGKTALSSLGFKLINSDILFEINLKRAGLEAKPENIYSDAGQELRNYAKALTKKKLELALIGRLGLVIDGTGKDFNKIKKQAEQLRSLGYDVSMIFVNTDLDTALQRNRQRSRSLPDSTVESMWKDVQKNLGALQSLFSQKMYIVDNSIGSDYESDSNTVYKKIMSWSKTEPDTRIAKKWIQSQRKK